MSALAGAVTHPTAKFDSPGRTVAGRIIEFADVQERGYVQGQPGAGLPKWWRRDGKGTVEMPFEEGEAAGLKPVYQVRVLIEQEPGNPDSRANLYITGKRMKDAVKEAMGKAGASDLSVQSDISITFTGYEGPAKCYTAAYSKFDPTA